MKGLKLDLKKKESLAAPPQLDDIILLTPGPVPLSSKVQTELGRKMTHHRSKEIQKTFLQVQSQLKQIFETKETVYILNSSGTDAMEAALVNTLSPQDEVLAVCAGKFGVRWKEMASAHQLKADEIQVPWGQAVTADLIEEKLNTRPRIKAVLIQACETSTAVFHPIEEISRLIRNKRDTLLIVDAISALTTVDLKMDEWGIDVLIGGSQKSFALPAGLSFIALSKKAQEFQKKSLLSSYYFDLKKERKANPKGQTAFTGNVSFIRALKASLDEFQNIGILNMRKKYRALSTAVSQFCRDLGLSLFSSAPGPAVTAIHVPEGVDGSLVKKTMEEQHHVIVGGGQDHLKGKIIRFGHLGPIAVEDYIQGLKIFGQVLREQKPDLFSQSELNSSIEKVKKFLMDQNL